MLARQFHKMYVPLNFKSPPHFYYILDHTVLKLCSILGLNKTYHLKKESLEKQTQFYKADIKIEIRMVLLTLFPFPSFMYSDHTIFRSDSIS